MLVFQTIVKVASPWGHSLLSSICFPWTLLFLRNATVTNIRNYVEQKRPRFNPINIQMLSSNLQKQIFGETVEPNEESVKRTIEHLKEHGLWGKKTDILPDVDLQLKLCGENIEDHFYQLGYKLSASYLTILDKLSNTNLPSRPKEWLFASGWTRYGSHGKVEVVDFPLEPALVFDVEVCVQEGNYPTLATAVSQEAWYSWCSERLVHSTFSWSKEITLADLIPLETVSGQIKPPQGGWIQRLIIGHNVGFDRAYVKEQYLLQGTKLRFLDTLSLHMCVSGLTGVQRAMSVAHKNNATKNFQQKREIPPSLDWLNISSLNNLIDVYALYCEGPPLEKEAREVFTSGSLADIRNRFQELTTYCSYDVVVTHQILQKLLPLFFDRFPHPVTFMGMLEMSTAYLPVNQNWERYLHESQATYDDIQKELKLSLMHLADDACTFLHDNRYKEDPWLWDLDWSVKTIRHKKEAVQLKRKKVKVKADEVDMASNINELSTLGEEESEDITDCLPSHLKDVFSTTYNLYKILPFLPGYPAWYRELCMKPDDENLHWEPGPILISTQIRSVPKLMRLTWDGFPLHYDAKHGWGYLVPGRPQMQPDKEHQSFPLEHLLKLCPHQCSEGNTGQLEVDNIWLQLSNPRESYEEERHQWEHILQSSKRKLSSNGLAHRGNGPYEDVNIRGCWFFRLPHKDGPQKRVGNPLAKDFLAKVADGTLQAQGGGKADRALFLSKMLSYWKNSHKRIMLQMVVWLNKNELPHTVVSHDTYAEDNLYGVILPRLITAGTVTRRAVEPTWMTASNAYPDRIGSELKSMVQAPPGYHLVGADVDSQELWIAAILGDAHFTGIHGSTAFGWMTLQGKKSEGTDMHSKTASSVNISRDQAKTINYGRIYGAGRAGAQRLLMQFNHRLSAEEAKQMAKKMYAGTKGVRKHKYFTEEMDDQEVFVRKDEISESGKKIWVGGSESHMFNKLEEIAESEEPRTPVLGCQISRALEPKTVSNNFMTSRVNWVVQSSAVDYLHLILVSMKWFFEEHNISGRFSISIHDEVRYLVESKSRYKAALALQITNLLTRSLFAYKLGMHDLPQSVAFFSSVDIDTVLRKEVTMDCKTPSNPHGLEKGYGIPPGESLNIQEIIAKTGGSLTEH